MEALRIDGLSKSFGGLEVLSDLSLSLEVGERVALIGPNGAGKTTLLTIISGAQPCNSGRISVWGQDITRMPAYARVHLGLGCSFQINHLFLDLTVLENVLLALHGLKRSRFQMLRPITSYGEVLSRAQSLLESIEMWKKKDEPVRAISYGEQRKMEIVLGLASEPKLLLLDEPTAGLSLAEIPPFINAIKTLAAGTTVLFTSHDMDVVFGLAERVVVLYFGQIIAQGTPEAIQADPRVREIYLGIEEGADHC